MEGGENLTKGKPSNLKLRRARVPPSRKLRLLQRLKRAVGALRLRKVDNQATDELSAAQAKLKKANLEALERLRRIAIENTVQVSASERRRKVMREKRKKSKKGGVESAFPETFN